MTIADIVKTVAEAFDVSDNETILSHMADDVQWLMLGNPPLIGKESLRKFFNENPNTNILSVTRDNVIIEGNKAAINGEARCEFGNGTVCDMYYCDIYELENSRIKKLTSYCVDKKK